ncbi:unnamed protein product [Linum trigynum]|uniref:Protein PHLOEM PROTEIN 2-LIKE A10 n=1 Tax=Linum trigynum TaxID=586398 RepID=A0AAV2E4W0_9ROSI
MDLSLVKKTGLLNYTRKNKNWVLLLAALGFSSYGAYKVYNSPSISMRRRRLLRLLGAFLSMGDAISNSAETISVVSNEFKDFIKSESDRVPNSMNQMSKLSRSNEFSESVVIFTKALTVGILTGYQPTSNSGPGFMDSVIDKLATPSGSGFVSAIVGSFARNLVAAYYECSSEQGSGGSASELMELLCSPKCKDLIADCTQLFVSTAVAVYLDKTLHINSYDQLFAGLTNPKHEDHVKDLMVSVSNSAVATLVKSSHAALTAEPKWKSSRRKSSAEGEGGDNWVGKMSSTLAVPSNRKLVVDVSGKVMFEAVRSLLEFVVERLRECVGAVHQAVVENGFEAARYVTAKSYAVTDLCLSLCLSVLDSVTWILVPV